MAGAVLDLPVLRDLGLCEDLPCASLGWDGIGRAGVTGAASSREQRAGIQWDCSGFRSAAAGGGTAKHSPAGWVGWQNRRGVRRLNCSLKPFLVFL